MGGPKSTKARPILLAAIIAILCLLAPVWSGSASDCSKTSVGFIPLSDLGAGSYKGMQGGLYPGGSNMRPPAHEMAGLDLARSIGPLDSAGRPDPSGHVVLLSIGMSNTTQEFSTFKPIADSDPAKNPSLEIVDGAQGGMSADRIFDLNSPNAQQYWQTVNARLSTAGVTPAQVQIAWVKEADASPTEQFPNDAITLKSQLADIARILKQRFPNIKLAYYSSRIYAGYATTNLNPEPFAYQSGFAVKWLIQDQLDGSADLNFDASRGEAKAPWLAWGPYLWADGLTPRSDGLTYSCSDFISDGTHPAPGGARDKVAKMLLDFFKTDTTTRPWFLSGQAAPTVTVVSPNGGERFRLGDQVTIQWTATNAASQDILLSIDKGRTFSVTIASGLAGNLRNFNWTIPADASPGKARIRVVVRDAAGNTASDDSDGNFKIRP